MSDLAALQDQTLAAIAAAPDEAALEAVRVSALGKKGAISALLATLGKLAPDERKIPGAEINGLKDAVTEALASRRAVVKSAALEAQLAREAVDLTLPVRLPGVETGRIHPITQVTDEIVAIFADMGFAVAEGPDIESDDYNFTKLNFPLGHPAREMHDTFFLQPDEAASAGFCAPIRAPCRCAPCCRSEAADPGDLPGPHLPHGFRPDPHPDVPSSRGPGGR